MKIINRTTITNALTNNMIKGETGILPMLTTNPQILVDHYGLNKELSDIVEGFNNIDAEEISETSKMVYNKYSNIPMGGIDSLLMESTYDEEEGWNADYSSTGFIFANTINITEHDFFVVTVTFNGIRKLIFKVTEVKKDFIKNMSIIQFDYKFAYDSADKYVQLEKQVRNRYVTMSSKLGSDFSLVIEEEKYITLEDKLKTYVDLIDYYKGNFYSNQNGQILLRFVMGNEDIYLLDRILSRTLVLGNVLYFDKLVDLLKYEFGNLHIKKNVIDIDLGLNDSDLKESVYYKVFNRLPLKQYKAYPVITKMSPHLAKYQNTRALFCGSYSNEPLGDIEILNFSGNRIPLSLLDLNLFDDDFIDRLKLNIRYEDDLHVLRNYVIQYYNGEDIDFDSMEIEINNDVESYYLIPIIIHAYNLNVQQSIK